jgi:hypothetical protein
VILPFQLTREKIPVNFLLFTGSLDSLSHKLCFRVRRRADRNGCRLTRQHQTIAAVIYWWPSWLDCATIFSVFRERSQLPRTKRPGKTIVKTMFGHEQHDAWPNEPDCFVVLSACWSLTLSKRRRRLQFRPEYQGVRAPARQRRCSPAAVQVSGFHREQRGRHRCLLECPQGTHFMEGPPKSWHRAQA